MNQHPRGYCHLFLVLPVAKVIINFGEFLFPKFSQPDNLSNQHLSFVWSCERNQLSGILVSSRTWYFTGSFPFRLFSLILFFKETLRHVSNTTITSSKSFIRFKMMLLKHALISNTVFTDYTFADSFCTTTIPSTTAFGNQWIGCVWFGNYMENVEMHTL